MSVMTMCSAARDGDIKALERLLADGADPNGRDPDTGIPPLHWAVSCHSVRMVRLLAKAGADVNQHDAYGRSALAYARYWSQVVGSTKCHPVIHALLLLGAH